MAKKFRAHLDILPPAQRRLWGELGSVPGQFVLYGGTALALHLGHRESEDLDFFADRVVNGDDLYRMTPFLQGSQITQLEPNTLTRLVERGGAVKVSFFGLPQLGRVRAPIIADNRIKIDSLLDIAAAKAVVVQQRAQAKDYIDIDALMTMAEIDLPKQLAAARAVRGPAFAPTATLKALAHFDDGDLATLPADVRRRLARAVADVNPLRLPIVRRMARKGGKQGKRRDK